MLRPAHAHTDAFSWLYACRGLYQLKEYALVIDGLSRCLRQEETMKEALHLLAFSLLHTQQNKAAAAAFYKSIQAGNDSDWQVRTCRPALHYTTSCRSAS